MIDDIEDFLYEVFVKENITYFSKSSRIMYEIDSNAMVKYHTVASAIMGADTQWDVHGGNFRVRLTRYGPQLVIIDPFVESPNR